MGQQGISSGRRKNGAKQGGSCREAQPHKGPMRMCWLLPPHRHLTAWLLRPVPPCPLASPSQVREAARRSVLSEMGLDSTPGKTLEFLRLKGFENAVIVAASRALDEWKQEAHEGGWVGAVGGRCGWAQWLAGQRQWLGGDRLFMLLLWLPA